MLTIWGRLNSHNVKKVAWFAGEIALLYVRHDVGGPFGMNDAYLAMNPNRLIPTIEDGDVVLWESN
ncbi:MAG: glutathione S-transferase N-terminal domain-containing protein, partial [bacterium]|nr:glutathione S-transferase N-terminal domain-containing protein [bacterium]